MKNIAINGFGRIGRLVFRILNETPNVKIVAVNDLTNAQTLAHLLQYDSAHGIYNHTVTADGDNLVVDGKKIPVYAEREPQNLPWKKIGVDLVMECSGVFRTREGMQKHIDAGAKRVLLSAPARDKDIKTIVRGVNDGDIGASDYLISNASCTTNCLAPVAKILDEKFGIERGFMTTIHAYTNDQRLQDSPHKDLRRARAAAVSIIPTSTGATKAMGIVLPNLAGKMDGLAMRVPTITGSAVDLNVVLKNSPTRDEINAAMKEAAEGVMKDILQYTEAPLVSVDIIGNKYASVFDAELTTVNGNMAKVVAWYDNEFGYSHQICKLAVEVLERFG